VAFALLGWDGTDEGAPARRAAARERHLALITAMAEDGRLALGAPLLAAGGAIAGSLMILSGDDRAVADAYLADDPYVTGDVWREIALWGTRFGGLPYRPLPGAG
jgi:uncharacterized protein YciI